MEQQNGKTLPAYRSPEFFFIYLPGTVQMQKMSKKFSDIHMSCVSYVETFQSFQTGICWIRIYSMPGEKIYKKGEKENEKETQYPHSIDASGPCHRPDGFGRLQPFLVSDQQYKCRMYRGRIHKVLLY